MCLYRNGLSRWKRHQEKDLLDDFECVEDLTHLNPFAPELSLTLWSLLSSFSQKMPLSSSDAAGSSSCRDQGDKWGLAPVFHQD